ncbi:hypothetical protein [Sporosarcina sp. SAFN-010]|uniref:hypothetical protein n=1 Tax=Sporosarcina sp. SAFN-010 TaxID=3387273 RepID=UPI003F800078
MQPLRQDAAHLGCFLYQSPSFVTIKGYWFARPISLIKGFASGISMGVLLVTLGFYSLKSHFALSSASGEASFKIKITTPENVAHKSGKMIIKTGFCS